MTEEPPLCFRPFTPGDGEAVVRLWRACGLVRPVNDPWKDLARKACVDPELFILGTRATVVVASAMAGYEGHRGWVNYVAVDPAYRRRGYGRQLMAEVERRLRERNCPKINLMVRQDNSAVVGFYQSLGYKVDPVVCLGKRLEHH